MPTYEQDHILNAYDNNRIILEYGSGASTKLACNLQGKYVMSVDSDLTWVRNLRTEIMACTPRSMPILYYVDIGPTGPWGRALTETHWRNYHRYPNAIWDEPFFRHPDVILIDGRFRVACLVSAMLHAERDIQIMFDDYQSRPKYHCLERIIKPSRFIGRMAEFEVVPGMINRDDLGFAVAQFFDVTVHGLGPSAYDSLT